MATRKTQTKKVMTTSPKKAPAKKQSNKAKPKINIGIMASPDAKWQAEQDCQTLMQAEKIKSDSSRLTKAKAMAKQKAAEAAKITKI